MSCAGDVRENGHVLENENGECESPAWIDLTIRGEIPERY